jgi:hypothetical protein
MILTDGLDESGVVAADADGGKVCVVAGWQAVSNISKTANDKMFSLMSILFSVWQFQSNYLTRVG